MANKTFQPVHRYRLIDQQIALIQAYSDAKCYIRNSVLFWEGDIQPTALSRIYHIVVIYRLKARPVVMLKGDNIQGLDRPDFPHKFSIDRENHCVSLCLHLSHEFNSTQLRADTIIPWTAEWLYFYEVWLATGEWCGGGKHPGRDDE